MSLEFNLEIIRGLKTKGVADKLIFFKMAEKN
mgnify:CR=1 FL=1